MNGYILTVQLLTCHNPHYTRAARGRHNTMTPRHCPLGCVPLNQAMTTPSQDFEASEVTEDVVQLSSLCGQGCENMDIHPNAVIGLLIGGFISIVILVIVALYVYASVKHKPRSIAAIKDVKKEEIVPNSENTTKRTINEGITNAAYVDQELSRPSTSRHESTLNSIDIETAITLYSEDDVDYCVWGQPTSDIVASTVNPSSTPPMCIHSGILPTPAPPVIDSGSDVAARPSSLDVSSIVPDQSESVLVDDALPQVNGVLRVSYNKDEDTAVVEIDNTVVDNRREDEDHDDVRKSTEEQDTAEIENDQAATEDNDSNDHLAQCNDDSDTSGIRSADNDSAKTPSSICVVTTDAVETPASPTANDADDEYSDIDDVDLAGVVVNSSFDSTDNTLVVNDVVVDRAARRITIGSLSLEFNVGGRLDEDGNKRSSIVITQSEVEN